MKRKNEELQQQQHKQKGDTGRRNVTKKEIIPRDSIGSNIK